MTLNEIVDIAKSIQAKWTSNVVNSRPGEQSSLQSHLGVTATYSSITAEISRWVSVLSDLAKKPRVSQAISKHLILPLGVSLQSVSKALDQTGNGVEWICTERNFATQYASVIYLVRALSLDSAREAAAITDAAKDRISQDISVIQNATEHAKFFSDGWPDLNIKIATIEDAEESASSKLEVVTAAANKAVTDISKEQESISSAATTSSEEINSSLESFNAALKTANEVLADAQKIHTEAQKIRGETQSIAAKTKMDLENSTVALNSAIEQEKQTQSRLTKALQSAQMEGLAGSFTTMSLKTETSIQQTQQRFDRALLYLLLIGALAVVFEIQNGFAKTAEEFAFRLIRMLSLATPGIWIAWIASRKLSALNRVFTDYQYKSASALAYESYRQTVNDSGNDELKQQLLAFAIRSFGENPTHYYDSSKNEASSPLEAILEKMPLLGKNKSDASKTT